MPELREVFEMATRQIEPDVDTWREQEARQRRRSRNRRTGVYALVAPLVIAATVIVVSALADGTGGRTPIAPLQRPSDGVALVDLDGTIVGIIGERGSEEVQALLREPLNGLSLSPDGTRVALSDGTDVYVMNVDGTALRRLARGVTPSWSPDGTRIAYGGGRAGIRVMSADGMDRREVFGGVGNLWPAWSPDGERIAFQLRYYGTTHGIAVIDVDGGDPLLLTNRGRDAFPSWHPAGDSIVFTRVGESQDLYTAASDGSTRATPLIATDMGESIGRWSPTGDLLAYVTFHGLYETDSGVMDVHVLDTRTGEDRVILEGATSVGWVSDEVLIVIF